MLLTKKEVVLFTKVDIILNVISADEFSLRIY